MKNYVEVDPETLSFKFPYRIHLQKPKDVPVAEIDTDDGIPLHRYRIEKRRVGKNEYFVAVKPKNE